MYPYATTIHDSYTIQFICNINYTQILDYSIDNRSMCDNSRFIHETIHIWYKVKCTQILDYSIDNESICENSRFIYETIHIHYKYYIKSYTIVRLTLIAELTKS